MSVRNVNDGERWFFSKEKLQNTPSRRCGVDTAKEVFYRQQAATLIQDMGQKLLVSQLCINSAIVYMHRFYMFHSFTKFHRNLMAPCCLFLACKVEEQPRKLELLLKVAWNCMNREGPPLDVTSSYFKHMYDELVRNENVLLATLGFDCSIDHPHTHVVRCCHLIRASRDLAQTSYFMATNSLHLTVMCLAYRSTLVACVCIYLVYKWSGHEIPRSSEGRDWFWYVDRGVTLEQLERVSEEFLLIFNQCPSKLKKKIMSSSKAISDQEAERRHRNEGSKSLRTSTSGSGESSAVLSSLSSARNAAPSSVAGGARGVSSAHASVVSSAAVTTAFSSSSSSTQVSSSSAAARLGPAAARAYRERKEREHQVLLNRERRGMGPERDWRPGGSHATGGSGSAGGGVGSIFDRVTGGGHARVSASSAVSMATSSTTTVAGKPSTSSTRLSTSASVGDVRQLLRDVDGRHSLLQPPTSSADRHQRHSGVPGDATRHSTSKSHGGTTSSSVTPIKSQPLLPNPVTTAKSSRISSNGPPSVPAVDSSSVSSVSRRDVLGERINAGLAAPEIHSTVLPAVPQTASSSVVSSVNRQSNMPTLSAPPDSPPLILPDVLVDAPTSLSTMSAAATSTVQPAAASLMNISSAPPAQPAPSLRCVIPPTVSTLAGGSIFSPPAVVRSSAPELVLPKIDDIPMFSPLKTGSSTVRLEATVSTSSRDVTVSSMCPTAEVTTVHSGAVTSVVTTSSLPTTGSQPSTNSGEEVERHKHREKKKKKKEHKEHKAKKEKKKHKDKDLKKSKHEPRDEGLSKLRITISKDRLSSSGVTVPVTVSSLQGVPELSQVSSPASGLKIRIGKDKVTPVPADDGQAKKRARETDLDDSGSHHHYHHRHHHHSKHKSKHKRKRQDSEMSDSLQF